jgi:hypothetical protein
VSLNYVGQPMLIAITTTTFDGVPADPGLIDLGYTDPAGDSTGVPFGDLVHDAEGAWHYVLQTIGFDPGAYRVQCSCSGGLEAVSNPKTFVLAPQAVPGL